MVKEKLIQTIYQDLESAIISGIYPIDSKLPSERELSIKYKATRIVIREAIAMLTQSGLVETRPQKGTFIRDFYDNLSLDSMVNVARITKKIEVQNLKTMFHFFSNSEPVPSIITPNKDISESLKKIEAAIIRKKLYDNPQVLAECDYIIIYEIAKVCLDHISIAFVVSLKPLSILTAKIIYIITDNSTEVIDIDINIFKALNSNAYSKAIKLMREKNAVFEKVLNTIEKIEDNKVFLNSVDGKKGKIFDLQNYD